MRSQQSHLFVRLASVFLGNFQPSKCSLMQLDFSQLERSGGIARTKIDKSEERLGCNVGKWESLKKMSQILIVHKSCKSWKIILSVGKMEESEPDLKLK